MKARRPAANRLPNRPSIITAMNDSVRPMANASPRVTRPDGIGRLAVRFMTASKSASHHMFNAPEAPAPIAMHRIVAKAMTGCTATGAVNKPTAAVKITKRMTRGFSRST